MKTIILLFLLALPISLSAQQTCSKGEAAGAAMQFKKDKENNRLGLYTLSGMLPIPTAQKKLFFENYAVSFHDFGCVAPANLSYYKFYNALVFKYLTENFENTWHQELPRGIIGWEYYKKTN